jgi:hypothetical protein
MLRLWFLLSALVICPPPLLPSALTPQLLESALALDENFDLYLPPQVAAMGKAMTADATGYLSNYYNPAGLAKATRRKVELTLLDLEGNLGFAGMGRVLSAKSFGINHLFTPLAQSPNTYTFFSFAAVPSISFRNFSFSVLGAYRYAGLSDGTNIDIDAIYDVAPTIAFASNFFGNRLKLGVSGKAIVRNQLKGSYAISTFDTAGAVDSLSREGLGLGGDLGAMLTFPVKYLPTFAVVWKDALNTNFSSFHVFNSAATGVPDSITQSVNAAMSFHPWLGKKLMGTFAFEIKHVQDFEMPLTKKLHFGFQIEDEKSFFLWGGLNQSLLPTFGVALRLPGGNLELATYAEDTAAGEARSSDRRFMFRYTVGW